MNPTAIALAGIVVGIVALVISMAFALPTTRRGWNRKYVRLTFVVGSIDAILVLYIRIHG